MRWLLGVGLVLIGACTLGDLSNLSGGATGAPDAGPDAPHFDATVEASASAEAEAGPTDITNGLVGRWRFDETSGTVAADTSGKSNVGEVDGATWTYGPVASEGALGFDGTDDHVSISGTLVYATKDAPFSFSAWFNVTDFTSSSVQDIMQLRSDFSMPWHVIVASHPDYEGISLGSSDTWVAIKTGTVPTLGAWHHVVAIYNGHGVTALANFAIYLDGVSQPIVASGGYGGQTNESIIGASSNSGTPFNGRLRDVRIYGRALGTDEVAALAAAR
jgi:hypothetical protein